MPDTDLQPGPEMDLAVAKAVGLEAVRLKDGVWTNPYDYDGWKNPDGGLRCLGTPCIEFRPSTDLNRAFEAAEKAGLFGVSQDGVTILHYSQYGGWYCEKATPEYDVERRGSRGSKTPAEAISRAILALRPKDSA